MKRFIFIGDVILLIFCIFSSVLTPVFADETLDQIRKAIREKGAKWTAEENWVTQLSIEDRKRLCGTYLLPPDPSKAVLLDLTLVRDLPSEFDWRDNNGNWVTPVKNQGSCGSCWDFSAVAQVESWWKIYTESDSVIDLSEQFVLSCSEGDCEGWMIQEALDFIQETGVPGEACFEYQADDELPCIDACPEWEDEAVIIPGWGYVTLEEAVVENIKNGVYRHPVSARFIVYEDFDYYYGGIYEHVIGDEVAGHAILIVGWNDADSCWICKNSWGSFWGESGYFRIKWGECEIGGYMPFIWEGVTGGPALSVSPDTLELQITAGDSEECTIMLSNLGADVVEYFAVDYELPIRFHISAFNGFDDYSWWCGDPEIGGYDDHWLQFLDTPQLDLSGTQNPQLSFMGYWAIEDPFGAEDPWDGWDGCNVWISQDGGETFSVAEPVTPEYNCESLWSFGHPDEGWDFGEGIPGWGGLSGGWTDVQFDLSCYISDSVIVRFAFASDLAFCTRDLASITGFFIDEVSVTDGGTPLFRDLGDDINTMYRIGKGILAAEWMDLSNESGRIPSNQSANICLTVKTNDLTPGLYWGTVNIASNDTMLPEIEIPVNLEVLHSTKVDLGENDNVPENWELMQNYPNPFNRSTTIPYLLNDNSFVDISIYDFVGKRVKTFIHQDQQAGHYQVRWDGTDHRNRIVGSGIYFIKMRKDRESQTRKILFIK